MSSRVVEISISNCSRRIIVKLFINRAEILEMMKRKSKRTKHQNTIQEDGQMKNIIYSLKGFESTEKIGSKSRNILLREMLPTRDPTHKNFSAN